MNFKNNIVYSLNVNVHFCTVAANNSSLNLGQCKYN